MPSLEQIIKLTKELRAERDILAARVTALNQRLQEAQSLFMPGIRTAVNNTAEQHSVLKAAIDCSRDLFLQPRTITVHGFRIGLIKGKGRVIIDDPDLVVARIEKAFTPRLAESLIKTTKTPDRDAIAGLDTTNLKKIGVQIEATGDNVLIKPTDSSVDKIVTALLKSATEDKQQREAA